jgi:hypothetical protein
MRRSEDVEGIAKAVAAVIVVVTTAVATGFAVYKYLEPPPPPELSGELKLADQHDAHLADYLAFTKRSGHGYTRPVLNGEGQIVVMRVSLRGAARKRVSIQWVLVTEPEHELLRAPYRESRGPTVETITPPASAYRGVVTIWVPCPRARGTYRARIELSLGPNQLDFQYSSPFSVSRIDPVKPPPAVFEPPRVQRVHSDYVPELSGDGTEVAAACR